MSRDQRTGNHFWEETIALKLYLNVSHLRSWTFGPNRTQASFSKCYNMFWIHESIRAKLRWCQPSLTPPHFSARDWGRVGCSEFEKLVFCFSVGSTFEPLKPDIFCPLLLLGKFLCGRRAWAGDQKGIALLIVKKRPMAYMDFFWIHPDSFIDFLSPLSMTLFSLRRLILDQYWGAEEKDSGNSKPS